MKNKNGNNGDNGDNGNNGNSGKISNFNKKCNKTQELSSFYDNNLIDAKRNKRKLDFWGDLGIYKTLLEIKSTKENWERKTEAMEIENIGCIIRDTIISNGSNTISSCFVKGVMIQEEFDTEGVLIARRLINY